MRRGNAAAVIVSLFVVSLLTLQAQAVPNINVGNYNLIANSGVPQDIFIPVTGGDTVTDFIMYAQIGDAVADPNPQPLFSSVQFGAGTMWSGAVGTTIGGTGPDAGGEVAQQSIGLASLSTLAATGNVVHLQITTLGVTSGTFPLKLKDTEYGTPSLFLNTSSSEINPTITNGSITIVPEPVSVGLLGVGAMLIGCRRRR